ncbi:MAG: hypothetical protein D6800_05870, partial [Candidatus Zixiibacteriota bacterium]
MPRIKVNLDSRSYPVVLGQTRDDTLRKELARVSGTNRVFVIFDANVYALHGKRVLRQLKTGRHITSFVIPSGERVKTRATVRRLQDFLISEGITRNDLV